MLFPLKQYKKSFAYSYTFGVFPTLELLQRRHDYVDRVLLHSKSNQTVGSQKILSTCRQYNIPSEINDRAIERLSKKENVYAIGVFRKYSLPLVSNENHVVLVNPSSMGNLGTIMRTMAGFNFSNLAIIQPSADAFDPKTIRASMGAIFQLNISNFKDINEYISIYNRQFYLLTSNGNIQINHVSFRKPYSLFFGNESRGLDPKMNHLGKSVSIRQSKNIDSFNLAISVGITLYQTTLSNQ